MYVYTLALAALRDALSSLCVVVTDWYLKVSKATAVQVSNEISRIEAKRDKKIDKTKEVVVIAAQGLLKVEQLAQEKIAEQKKKADDKVFKLKLKTKVTQ